MHSPSPKSGRLRRTLASLGADMVMIVSHVSHLNFDGHIGSCGAFKEVRERIARETRQPVAETSIERWCRGFPAKKRTREPIARRVLAGQIKKVKLTPR